MYGENLWLDLGEITSGDRGEEREELREEGEVVVEFLMAAARRAGL